MKPTLFHVSYVYKAPLSQYFFGSVYCNAWDVEPTPEEVEKWLEDITQKLKEEMLNPTVTILAWSAMK